MNEWATSPYTGIFTRHALLPGRPHDPPTFQAAGETVTSRDASGIGWTEEAAEAACLGEALERLAARPLPGDRLVRSSFADWPLKERAIPPEAWSLFHPEQYRQPGFPFEPFTPKTVCDWVCCREASSGESLWAPAEMVFLELNEPHRLTPGYSTGLACGRVDQPLVLRGLQETIERDALVGAWWGRYPLEEFAANGQVPHGACRPNMTYRLFRVQSPFSRNVTMVTLSGEDWEGFCFSVGSACRATLAESWAKSVLEAIQGRHYVRHLKAAASAKEQLGVAGAEVRRSHGSESNYPTTFAEHAVFYSLHPELLKRTVFAREGPHVEGAAEAASETLAVLAERLGPERPILVRDLTPLFLPQENLDWRVVRVIVPGLQPLAGHHELAHLGGSHWAPRGLEEYRMTPPHPFP